jgi:hypothetical protein
LARVKAFFDARRSGSAASEIAPGMQRLLGEQLEEMEERIAT